MIKDLDEDPEGLDILATLDQRGSTSDGIYIEGDLNKMTSKEILEAVLSKTISIQEAKALLEADFETSLGNDKTEDQDRVLTNAVGKALMDLAEKGSEDYHYYVLDSLKKGIVNKMSLDEIGHMILSGEDW
jgi:hypothetical protein